jgi:hypothetical protein
MSKTYTVTTTDLEEKALRWAECDPQKWLDTIVHHRAKIAMKELYSIELKKALANPDTETLSSNMEEVVLASTELTAKQRNEQLMNVPMPTPEATQEEAEAYIKAMGKLTAPEFVADSPRTFLGGTN